MPVALPPTAYRCTRCGWTRVVVPHGDVRIPGHDHFTRCPHCSCAALDVRPACDVRGALQVFAQSLTRLIQRHR